MTTDKTTPSSAEQQPTPAVPTSLERRGFMKVAGISAAASLVASVTPNLQSSAWAKGADGLEKTKLTVGIIPLTDCAPIVIAKEKGFFKKYGLDVTVSKESSWANIRDKVALGQLDGAQMLAGMPIAATLGVGAKAQATVTAFSMDLNGNGITVSNSLYDRMLEADAKAMKKRPMTAVALKKVIDADKKAGKPPMTFAMVSPVSTHNYEIRYWMASAGIDPDRDVNLIVIPPPQMTANLAAKNIVGYCVGEPWNQRAVEMGIGKSIITNYEIWNNSPEKVFGVTKAWADENPGSHKAVIKALIEASVWIDKAENRQEVVDIISKKSYVNAPVSAVKSSMTGTWTYDKKEGPIGMADFNVFHRYAANFPWHSNAVWFLAQMVRWGQINKTIHLKSVAESVYLPDLYREAAQELGIATPTVNYKNEGVHATAWMLETATQPIPMGPDLFFDGAQFDPHNPVEYLKQFPMNNLKISLNDLAKHNA